MMGGHLLSSFVTKSISIVLYFYITTKQLINFFVIRQRNKFVKITTNIRLEPPSKPEEEEEEEEEEENPEVNRVVAQENLR